MSPIAAIFLIVLVDVCAYTLVIPLLPIYAERLHATPLHATLLVSTFAFFQLVSGPVLGKMSDKIGRKPVLVASQVGTLAGLLVLAWAKSLWVVYVARIIDGATAGNISLAQAYISDHTKPQERAKSFGKIYIAFGVGFFLGPFATGLLSGYGLAAPIYAASGLSLLSILATMALLPRERSVGAKWDEAGNRVLTMPDVRGRNDGVLSMKVYSEFFRRPVLKGIFAETLFFGFCFATFTSGIALFDERRFTFRGHAFGAREIAFHFAFIGFLGILLQAVFIGRLVKWFGEPKVVRAGFLTLVLGYAGLALIHTNGALAGITFLTVFGHGVLRPTLSSLATQNSGKGEQGVVLGISQSLSSISQIGAPAFAGFLIDQGLLSSWAYLASSVAVLGIIAARWGSSRHAAKEKLESAMTERAFVVPQSIDSPPPRRSGRGLVVALATIFVVVLPGAMGVVLFRDRLGLDMPIADRVLGTHGLRRASPPTPRVAAEAVPDPTELAAVVRTKAIIQPDPEPTTPKKKKKKKRR